MKKKRKLLITGCGRSGTKYISELLKRSGFDVRHEADGADGIVSWPMTATEGESLWGPAFSEYEFETVAHQIRNPVKVISSCHTITDKSWNYIKKYIPINEKDSKLIMCAKYWYYWNLKAEKLAGFSYRIEDIDSMLFKLVNILGKRENFSKESLRIIPRNVNKRPHNTMSIKDIKRESSKLYEDILKLSLKYGYKKEDIIA